MSDPLRPDDGAEPKNPADENGAVAPEAVTHEADGAASLAAIAVGEPGDRSTRRTMLTMVGVAVLFGVALVAAAPVIVDAVLGSGPGQDPAAAQHISHTPTSPAAATTPSSDPDDASSKKADKDDDKKDEKDDGSQDANDTQQSDSDADGQGEDTGSSSTDNGSSGDSPDDSTSSGNSGAGNSGSSNSGSSGSDSGGSGTGGSGGGSGSGDQGSGSDPAPGSGGSDYEVVRSGQSFTLDKMCFPGKVLDLDSGAVGQETTPQGRYEIGYGGCAPNIDGNLSTSQPTAILGGSGRPEPADCADAAKNGRPLGDDQMADGTRLCLLTDGGQVAYVVIAENTAGAVRLTVTTWT